MRDLIIGLRVGILGMRKDEMREIFIHSDYAYGHQSNFPPCTPLLCQIELLSSKPRGSPTHVPSLLAEVENVPPPSLEPEALEKMRHDAAFAEGYNAWCFYRLGKDLYSMQSIAKHLLDLAENRATLDNSDATQNIDLKKLHSLLCQRLVLENSN